MFAATLRKNFLQFWVEIMRRLSRCKSSVFIPPLVASKKLKVLVGPGFMDFKHVFNPGFAQYDGEGIVLARAENDNDYIQSTSSFYTSSHYLLMRLDETFEIKDCSAIPKAGLDFMDGKRNFRFDDPRIFIFRNRLYLNHIVAFFHTDRIDWNALECFPIISELDIKNGQVIPIGKPKLDFSPKQTEKNWVFFEHLGELYLLYSFAPYILLKLTSWTSLEFTTVVKRDVNLNLPGENVGGLKALLSTNPVTWDADHFLVLIHKFFTCSWSGRRYLTWAVLIQKESLLPVKITSRPVFNSFSARGECPGVIYPTSCALIDDDLVVFVGEGDSYCSYAKINKKILTDNFVKMDIGGGYFN